jgi:hypothetical protein
MSTSAAEQLERSGHNRRDAVPDSEPNLSDDAVKIGCSDSWDGNIRIRRQRSFPEYATGAWKKNVQIHLIGKQTFVKERIQNGDIFLQYLQTKDMPADVLTKPVGREALVYLEVSTLPNTIGVNLDKQMVILNKWLSSQAVRLLKK